MDANAITSASSVSSSGDVSVTSIASSVGPVIVSSDVSKSTPALAVELSHHQSEANDDIKVVVQAASSTSSDHDSELSPPPILTAASAIQQSNGSNGSASASLQNASNTDTDESARSHSPPSPASNPIASDHCYGLPYQDHNYGTASFANSHRNSSGNGNGSSGSSNNGGSYSAGNQRHPSGSLRLSISSAGTGSPAPGSRLSNGNGTPAGGANVVFSNRRLNFYPNGSGKPPNLPQYGSTTTASNSGADARISPGIGSYAERTSFSDDDGPVIRPDAYGLMSTGLSAPVMSPVSGNGPSLVVGSSSIAVPSSPGNGTSFLSHSATGQSGITVTASGQVQPVRGRLRSIGMRPPTDDVGHNYHGTPGIHPRLAPPNPARCVGTAQSPSSSHGTSLLNRNPGRIITSNTIGSSFNPVMLSGPPGPQKQQSPFSFYSMKPSTPSLESSSFPSLPRQGNVFQTISLPAANGGVQPPPKRPGRPKGAKSGGQQQLRHQTMQQLPPTVLISGAGKIPATIKRRRKQPVVQTQSSAAPPGIYATAVQQTPGTPFSPSGLIGQPLVMANRTPTTQHADSSNASAIDTVTTVLEAVAAGLITPSLPLPPSNATQHSAAHQMTPGQQKRSAPSSSGVQEAISKPLAVGTSPVIPAHPMFANSATSVSANVNLLGSGLINAQQHLEHQPAQVVQSQDKLTTLPSTSNAPATPVLGKQGFREIYNSRMSALMAQVGLPDKDDDIKPKTKPMVKSPHFKKNQRAGASLGEAKGNKRGRQKKSDVTGGQGVAADIVKTESIDGASVGSKKTKNGNESVQNGADMSTDEAEGSSADEWDGKDYTTRCLCEMKHNDEFMIQCDRCEVWQHCECMGLDTKNIPDSYLCEQCSPRPLKLTREDALSLQQAKVLQWKRKKAAAAARRKRLFSNNRVSISSNSSAVAGGRGRPRKSLEVSVPNVGRKRTISSDDTNPNKRLKLSTNVTAGETFAETTKNVCTAKVAKAVRAFGDMAGAANLLSQLPSQPPCKFMYVAIGRHGLVATDTVLPDLPIIEYRGKVCWSTDFEIPDGKGGRVPVVAPYLLFYQSGGADGSDIFSICVDARYTGTSARFVRRSCQPNSQVKHVVYNGVLHILLVSTELIECGAEITIPFDYDISKCNFELECACMNSSLPSPNPECPIEIHNKSLPLPDAISSICDSDDKKHAESAIADLIPAKRRPGRPPGSGKSRQKQANNRGGITTSATTAAARKKSKKARGFKVKIIGKKKGALLTANSFREEKLKGAGGKLKGRRQAMRIGKKFKPVATADLTKRRFSEDRTEEVEQNRSESTTKSPIAQKAGSVKFSRSKSSSITSPPIAVPTPSFGQQNIHNEHLSREDRKIQALMEQISRMEQREQKKAEKKMAKNQNEGGRLITKADDTVIDKKVKIKQAVARRKSATMDRAVAAARRKRTESEAALLMSSAKRSRVASDNGETSSSISSLDSDDDNVNPSKTFGRYQSSSRGFSNQASSQMEFNFNLKYQMKSASTVTSSSPPLTQHLKASDVAKKRWLRQAMSEETSKKTVETPGISSSSALQIDTKVAGQSSSLVQASPPPAVPPPKKRFVHDFNYTATTTQSEQVPAVVTSLPAPATTSEQTQNEVDIKGEPLSTVEAAQLLAELHHHQLVVSSQKSSEPIDGRSGLEEQQPTAPAGLKMIQPEEQPSKKPVSTEEKSTASVSDIALSIVANTIVNTMSSMDGANFIPSPYFTSPTIPVGGDRNEVLSSYISTTPAVSHLYSAIEDDVPTVPATSIAESSQLRIENPEQMHKKKVKMSIDEYKKRKRESVNETQPTTPNAESTDGSPNLASAPATSASAPVVQRQQSFIPQIKETDVASRNIRLSSVPDPETIGKCSSTLEDLRKRIYNQAFKHPSGNRQPTSTDVQDMNVGLPPPQVISAPIGSDPRTAAQANSMKEPSTPPRDANAIPETVDDSPDVHQPRLSLSDRLKLEFGLD